MKRSRRRRMRRRSQETRHGGKEGPELRGCAAGCTGMCITFHGRPRTRCRSSEAARHDRGGPYPVGIRAHLPLDECPRRPVARRLRLRRTGSRCLPATGCRGSSARGAPIPSDGRLAGARACRPYDAESSRFHARVLMDRASRRPSRGAAAGSSRKPPPASMPRPRAGGAPSSRVPRRSSASSSREEATQDGCRTRSCFRLQRT